jgi:D-beta-D-heptose 7-phosphate kinase/D-beta-D-heptose 1-phosphate adenosyltransferase
MMNDTEWIHRFAGLEIAVVGDLMMDEYVWGQANRVSPESPVLVLDVERETSVPGGAANVAANLLALGAKIRVFGAVGDDPEGEELKRLLAEKGADVSGIVTDRSRRTTRKTRVVAQSQQVLRIDREQSHPLPESVSDELVSAVLGSLPRSSAILVSDYDKGAVNPLTVPRVIQACQAQSLPFVVNAKPANVGLLTGASLVSLNLSEALAASGDKRFRDPAQFDDAGTALLGALNVERLAVTRGPDGLAVWERGGAVTHTPAHSVAVYDVAGAGDTVVAVLTLAAAVGAPTEVASRLAVTAAAVVVGKVGVATTSVEELLSHLDA